MSTCFDAVLFVVALRCDVLKAERRIFLRQAKVHVRWFYKLVERVYRLKDTWRSFGLGAAVIHCLIGKEWGRGFFFVESHSFQGERRWDQSSPTEYKWEGMYPPPLQDKIITTPQCEPREKCSPLPFIDIKTVFRVWKLFSVTQKASLIFFLFCSWVQFLYQHWISVSWGCLRLKIVSTETKKWISMAKLTCCALQKGRTEWLKMIGCPDIRLTAVARQQPLIALIGLLDFCFQCFL